MEDLLLIFSLDDFIALFFFLSGIVAPLLFIQHVAAGKTFRRFARPVKSIASNVNVQLIETYPFCGRLQLLPLFYCRLKQGEADREEIHLSF